MKRQEILIVEDENIVALDMRMRLEALGYSVVDVVDSGEIAVRRANDLKPDLVLMDIKLKGDQDGIDVASELRETTEVPVIFVTAFTDEKTLDRAKRASPYGYIVKPFHERELRIAIELAIYKHEYELSIRKAKDIAEEANRVKGEFLANMSHELKTPLNSVIGFTELALASASDDEQRDELTSALSAAKSLLTLINSILDFARMEAGKLAAVFAPFSLDELLDECVDNLAIAARAKGIEVAFRRGSSVPDALVGDRDLLKHILQNLLDNATKFTETGTIRLGVEVCDAPNCPGCGPTLEFEVSDTGMGMAKDKIGLAFNRFTQLDPSKTRKAGGTGLGLAIVAKSVELMEGGISVESEEGRGTTFRLRIPFELGPEESWPRSPVETKGSAILIGFEDEAFSNAAQELARIGLASRRAEGPLADDAAKIVIVDERAFPMLESALPPEAYAKLVVGTRLGGSTRARLAAKGIACTPLPLRLSGLRAAIARPELLSRPEQQRARAKESPAQASEAEANAREGSPDRARGGSGRGRSAPGSDSDASGGLPELAAALERAADSGIFVEAERMAQRAKEAFTATGAKKASRLAFAALLAARKGDRAALGLVAAQMREEAGEETKAGNNADIVGLS